MPLNNLRFSRLHGCYSVREGENLTGAGGHNIGKSGFADYTTHLFTFAVIGSF